MNQLNRSFWLGDRATAWEDYPRWVRLAAFCAFLLLAAVYCLKIGTSQAWLILIYGALAGRLMPTLFNLKPAGRTSERPTSVVGER